MSTQLLITALVIIATVTAQVQFDDATCLTDKGCMWSPPGCDPMNNCVKAFSWKVAGDYLNMELAGASSGGSSNYIAVGFSSDKKMGDEPVADCTFGPQGATVHLSYNPSFYNERIANYTAMGNDLQLLDSYSKNGRLYCAFRQRISPSQSSNRVLSLNRNVYVLLAVGTASEKALNPHSMTEGSPNYPFVSSGTVNLSNSTAYAAQLASSGIYTGVVKG